MVCFNCGKTGHSEEGCPLLNADKNLDTQSAVASINDQLQNTSIGTKEQGMDKKIIRPEELKYFGSWMLVKKQVRKRTPGSEKQQQTVVGDTTTPSLIFGKNTANGSRQSSPINPAGLQGSRSRFVVLDGTNQENISKNVENIGSSHQSRDIGLTVVDFGGTNNSAPIFSTVELGNNTNIPNSYLKTPNFSLGKTSNKHKNPITTNSLSKSYREKRKELSQSNIGLLGVINPNIPHLGEANTHSYIFAGKENRQISHQIQPQATSHQAPLSQQNPHLEIPLDGHCNQPVSTPRENPLLGEPDGTTLPSVLVTTTPPSHILEVRMETWIEPNPEPPELVVSPSDYVATQ